MRSDPIEEAFHSNDPTYVGAVVEALRQHAASSPRAIPNASCCSPTWQR